MKYFDMLKEILKKNLKIQNSLHEKYAKLYMRKSF